MDDARFHQQLFKKTRSFPSLFIRSLILSGGKKTKSSSLCAEAIEATQAACWGPMLVAMSWTTLIPLGSIKYCSCSVILARAFSLLPKIIPKTARSTTTNGAKEKTVLVSQCCAELRTFVFYPLAGAIFSKCYEALLIISAFRRSRGYRRSSVVQFRDFAQSSLQ